MKIRSLIVIALCAAIPALAIAKQPKSNLADEAAGMYAEDEPTLSAECKKNLSMVQTLVKAGQFAEAYEPWMAVYTECPNAHNTIYTNGAKIVDYFYANATDPVEKQKWAQLSVDMCDKRIQYRGNDPKYPKAYILGEKALAYCEHFPEDEVKETAYPWFKESIEGLQSRSKITVLVEFMKVSYNMYKSDPGKYGEQFINDYTLVSGYLQSQATDHTNKNASAASQQKDYVDNLFAVSGAANCEQLDKLYTSYVEENKESMENLFKVISLYKRVNCTESDTYFAASEYAHKMQPAEESAAGCAKMCMKKEDWRGAIAYYEEALKLVEDENDEDIDDYLYNIAYIYYDKLKNYTEARRYALKSLDANQSQGRCYILIGCCYAAAKPYTDGSAKSAILNKTVYWAAVDKFIKAK
ncbi:MAG: hypothetical protein K5660_08720, partial [Paludibacteraceae bacterium]|nr:hypothetical protein [Paludibacteraceae bacterium]